MSVRDEAGNVVIEMVLAVTLFGGVLWPAVGAVSSLAAAYRQGEDAAVTIARTWTVTDATARPTVISSLRSRLVSRGARPMTLNVTCLPSCDDLNAEVRVTATVTTGVIGFPKVTSSYRLARDAHGL